MPSKDELIRKAQQKLAHPAHPGGKNLQSLSDNLKKLHKGPSAPKPINTPLSTPLPVSIPTTSKSEEIEKLMGIGEPIQPAAPLPPDTTSLPPGIEGSLSFADLKDKKYNMSMEYLVPIEWIDFQDSEKIITERETFNREAYEIFKETPSFKTLVEDIKENGQKIPGQVRVNEFGLLKITDGWRRAFASKDSGRGVYLCKITEESDEEAATNALRLNLMREDLPEYHKLFEIKKLSEKYGLTYEVIARRTGFGTKSYISDCLTIFGVPAVEEALKNKQVSISTGRHLARKAFRDKLTHEQSVRMVKKVVSREVKLKDLKFLDIKNDKQNTKQAPISTFKLKADGSFIYPSIRFKPNDENLKNIEKTISNLEEILKILRKELKDRRH